MRSVNKKKVGILSFPAFLRPILQLIVPYLSDVDGVVEDRLDPADVERLVHFGTIAFFIQTAGDGFESESLIGIIEYFADDDGFILVDDKFFFNVVVPQHLSSVVLAFLGSLFHPKLYSFDNVITFEFRE
ncbi:hypothetical protein DLM86_19740 [Paenibacillus flagellatus]|uniref:Uncharacterized protein n=1 Tax=Paenibacillus flagellatus TaxID=2211139 RepID=A0A2V5JZV0_9BACL|nr:hypothetical protein DLM86_19740 [Paenibacillus flagellatus]